MPTLIVIKNKINPYLRQLIILVNLENLVIVTEKHISPKVLPTEHSSCWIKWKKGIVFDKIVLRYEADIDISRLFNIDEKIFDNKDDWNGKITIPKDMIQIDGFFGFTSYYTEILTNERKISYEIDFVSGNNIQTVHFENIVTRPMLEVVKVTPDRIQLSEFTSQLGPFSMKMKSIGSASLYNLSYFIEFVTSDKLTVEIITSNQVKSKEITLTSEQLTSQTIIIKGKGNGLMRMGAEYYDDYNTKYTDILKEIPIMVEQEQYQTIPISEQIEKQEIELLTISN